MVGLSESGLSSNNWLLQLSLILTFPSHCPSWEAEENDTKKPKSRLIFQFILRYFQILTEKDFLSHFCYHDFLPSLLFPQWSQLLCHYLRSHTGVLHSFISPRLKMRLNRPGFDQPTTHQEDHRRLTSILSNYFPFSESEAKLLTQLSCASSASICLSQRTHVLWSWVSPATTTGKPSLSTLFWLHLHCSPNVQKV